MPARMYVTLPRGWASPATMELTSSVREPGTQKEQFQNPFAVPSGTSRRCEADAKTHCCRKKQGLTHIAKQTALRDDACRHQRFRKNFQKTWPAYKIRRMSEKQVFLQTCGSRTYQRKKQGRMARSGSLCWPLERSRHCMGSKATGDITEEASSLPAQLPCPPDKHIAALRQHMQKSSLSQIMAVASSAVSLQRTHNVKWITPSFCSLISLFQTHHIPLARFATQQC